MATDRARKILEAFLAVAGDVWRDAAGVRRPGGLEDGVTESFQQAATVATEKARSEALGSRQAVTATTEKAVVAGKQVAAMPSSKAQTEVLASYTGLFESSPVYRQATAAGNQGTAGGVLKTVFANALGMAPLARLVMGLFGGGGGEEPAPLVKYALPPRMRFETANGPDGSLTGVDYGQSGLPRVYGERERREAQAERPAVFGGGPRSQDNGAPGFVEQAGGASGSGAATQVTIQVQAMDSKSFLDHKEDIARAVREAMLNMNSLNDVVSEL